jgi:hypothetical protein
MADSFEMKLPKVNPNEELEDISNNRFVPLFNVKDFEIRKEPGRDKGIDFRVEIKKNGVYTGFKFFVQLKATEKIERKADNSISISIDTSNINYLLNSGLPAYYCLYFKPDDIFLYENVNEFVKKISESHTDWQKQESHTLRLTDPLNEKVLRGIYNSAYDRGLCLRKLNQQLAESSSLVSEKMVVDAKLDVVSDSGIRKHIEAIGLKIINEARSIDVIKIHERGSQQIATTAKYNMVVGIAYYYTGELIKSLNFIKSAMKLKTALTPELLEHLQLFDITVRFALGMILKDEYESRLSTLASSDHIRYYVLIQKEKELYLRNADADVDKRYEGFFKAMEDILNAPDANENIKLLVKCELILYDGSKINMDFARGISTVKAYESVIGFSRQLRNDMLNEIFQRRSSWASKANDMRKSALNSQNVFVFYHILTNESKVNYEFDVYSDLINFGDQANFTFPNGARLEQLDNILISLEDSERYFASISHIDNLCVALSLQYEVLHYKADFVAAGKIINKLSDIIETYEYKDFKKKFDSLKSGGTTHEKFAKFYNDIASQSSQEQDEYESMVREMKGWDQLDRTRENPTIESEAIELFPIGHFQFAKKFRNDVFRILNVSAHVQKSFVSMWDEVGVIPVANIYCNPVNEEGYADVINTNDIVVWQNIYRIRKEFFERGFHRVELKFNGG